jgi:predicted house-cleaning noncanonical NTP pyrophosphatase (MazG superfamily)
MKLVRDNYIHIIPSNELHQSLTFQERKLFLLEKADEELQEVKDSAYTDIYEYADYVEVIYSLANLFNHTLPSINKRGIWDFQVMPLTNLKCLSAEYSHTEIKDAIDFNELLTNIYMIAECCGGFSVKDIEVARKEKLDDKGGFSSFLIWTGTFEE